jgi:RNA recognition motif-containing protein
MRGQAFIVFREIVEATSAKNNLNGYVIFGKSMVNFYLFLENYFCGEKIKNYYFYALILVYN